MSERQETIADIIAEMRKDRRVDPNLMWDNSQVEEHDSHYADRLEAAHKREADYAREAYESALKAEREALREQYEAGALVDGTRGDCAKLREALATIRERLVATYESEACFMRYSPNKPLVDLIDAALAAPPRNCDVYNNESCRMAYHLHGDGLMTMQAFADWLFAPATEKEGGAK